MTRLLIVAAAAVLSGCTSLASVASSPPALPPRCTPQQAADLPEGARIELTNESYEVGLVSAQKTTVRSVGTVLKASSEGVALANCETERRRDDPGSSLLDKTPYFGRRYRNARFAWRIVDVVWIPVENMGAVRILETTPAGYVSPDLDIDTQRRHPLEPRGVDVDFNTGEVADYVEAVSTPSGEVIYRRGVRSTDRRESGNEPDSLAGMAHLE